MGKPISKILIELPTHGSRKTIPKLLDTLSILGFISMLTLLILERNNFFYNHFIQKSLIILMLTGLLSFMISAYTILNGRFKNL